MITQIKSGNHSGSRFFYFFPKLQGLEKDWKGLLYLDIQLVAAVGTPHLGLTVGVWLVGRCK